MKYLLAGQESAERLGHLLSLTRINSGSVKSALQDHLCRGMAIEDAAVINGVPQGNVSRALASLNNVAEVVERLKELDWPKYQLAHKPLYTTDKTHSEHLA